MLRYYANGRVRWKSGMRCNTRTNWEFYAVIDGRCGAVLRDDAPTELQENTLWLFAPECTHAWKDDGRNPYHRLSLHFGNVPYPLDEVVRRNGGFLTRKLNTEDIAALRRIATAVEPHFCHPTVLSSLHFQRGLAELALLVLQDVNLPGEERGLTDLVSFKVEGALSWYGQHLADHPSVKEVADAMHVSPSHLRRLFWQARQASPKEAFRRLRIERAQQLMARSALTLEDVAHECGYASASHFCRDYKAELGFTPTTWRKKLVDRFTQPLPPGVVPVREYSARASERAMPA